MSERLMRLIERARHYRMSPQEILEQDIRFAYGNAHYENDQITMDLVAEALQAPGDLRDTKDVVA